MSLKMDPEKAVKNIKAKTIDAPRNDGQWVAVCEVVDCDTTADASKLHGWKTDKWVVCPNHVQ